MRTFNHGLRRRRFGVRGCQGVLCLGEIWQINFSIAVLQSQLCWNVVGTKLLKWKKLINEALDDFLTYLWRSRLRIPIAFTSFHLFPLFWE